MALALALTVGGQVVLAVIEGLVLTRRDSQGTAGTLIERIGFAFGTTGTTVAVLFLVIVVVLVSLPAVLDAPMTAGHQRVVSVSLWLALVLAPALAAGGVLTVFYNLHPYTVAGQPVPPFFRWQLSGFLLGTLAPAAVVLAVSVAARALVLPRRDRSAGPTQRA